MSDTVTALKNIKSGLMHARMFGPGTLNSWRSAAVDAEGEIEDLLKAALAAPQPVQSLPATKLISERDALYEALRAVLEVASVRIDDARIGVFDNARAALALVGGIE